ncbi:16S rRNA (cytidine(1402)-2'-O)-methyltransferase [bacterium]|nr:16S rRNA (cytidine(1402)-2'-O)-methyltransferase [bacterium]
MKKRRKPLGRHPEQSNRTVNDPRDSDRTEATLYLVSTPIGNLEDITLRAIKILNHVGLIAAEDTRQTSKLLRHYHINTRLTSYHDRNKERQATYLIRCLRTGLNVALVSDAGTPGIADPGYLLIQKALAAQIPVVSIPGVSAILAGLIVSGLATDRFTFYGFVPRKQKTRTEFFELIKSRSETAVFFETPHRLKITLDTLKEIVPEYHLVLCRELTKVHEQVLRGCPHDIERWLADNPYLGQGELTLLLKCKTGNSPQPDPECFT